MLTSLKGPTGQIRLARDWYYWKAFGYSTYLAIGF
jgi:hypothetical protein